MKKITLALLSILSINLSAQEYFQQEVNYTIDVELDDENHSLNGTVYIDYFNNSPNDLDFLWFHIWPNAYKNNTRTPYAFKSQLISTRILSTRSKLYY